MEKIEALAEEHVKSFGEILPGFRFGFKKGREYTAKYYFDFMVLTMEGKIPEETPQFGGPAGFTIDKRSHEIETLSFGELAMLDAKEQELDEVYNQLSGMQKGTASLNWLKSRYNLKSSDLLHFEKLLAQDALNKEKILEQLERIKKFKK